MKLEESKELLQNYVKTERISRNYDTTTDYENRSEDRCVAIEVILKELEKRRCQCPGK